MAGGFWNGLKRFFWWDYPRSSWQYEVMVTIILAFIFLTPREFFRDQPRPKNVMLLSSGPSTSSYLIEPPELLISLNEQSRRIEAEKLIQAQAGGKNRTLDRIEPLLNEADEIRGFVAYTRP